MHRLSHATENLLRLLILVCFTFLFYRVITKGDLLQLIHPQFTYNATVGLAIFALLATVQTIRFVSDSLASNAGRQDHKFAGCFYYIFIGTLAICFLIPAKSLGSITAGQKGLKHFRGPTTASTLLDNTASAPPINTKIQQRLSASVPKQAPILYINDENHIRLITAMYEDTANFINREIKLKGFVYRPVGLNDNQFMVVRFEISCCAADAVPSGLIVEWADNAAYKNDTWLEVRGMIQQGNYEGVPVPLLKAAAVSTIDPLPNPYVYTGDPIVPQNHEQNVPQTPPTNNPSAK